MGLRDILTGRHEVKGPAAKERLFAITTAYITLQAEHGIEPDGRAAIVFQPLSSADFEAAIKEMEDVVRETGSESGTQVATQDDSYGYRWMVLSNPSGSASVEDLAVGINAVSSSIEAAGHGERLLCAVFAFKDAQQRPVYFIYNYKRGYWYPFVPKGPATASSGTSGGEFKAGERSTERELQIKAQISSELPIEPELERWFPLWGIPI
ncbi:MAG TPA: hypothetical protein VGP17_11520 [Solirubrobacteraceae bacterium]|nr:hypothetical protein [Solirubrobacteraceae bacterium]